MWEVVDVCWKKAFDVDVKVGVDCDLDSRVEGCERLK